MVGACERCKGTFQIELFHMGFADSSYAYCDTCGIAAILNGWSKKWPKGVHCIQGEIVTEMEPHLEPCTCGGRFAKGQAPRCPNCKESLSAEKAAYYLEAQAPGAQKGWRWQRSWNAIYCAVIDDRFVPDNFKEVV